MRLPAEKDGVKCTKVPSGCSALETLAPLYPLPLTQGGKEEGATPEQALWSPGQERLEGLSVSALRMN